MATKKQTQAARRNITSAQSAAKSKRTLAHLPASTRREIGEQAAKGRARRSRMGKSDLIDAIRKAR
jgi:hypothetical protein